MSSGGVDPVRSRIFEKSAGSLANRTSNGMDEKALGQRLQLARKRAGLTQQELCNQAGLSYSTLAKIERGAIKAPSIFSVAAIADATQTSLNELMGLEASSPTPSSGKKRSKTGVTFVYFDIDGVIVSNIPFHAFTLIAHDHNLHSDVVENAFWRYNDAVCRGDIGLKEFNSIIGQELGISGFDWLKYYFKAAEMTPGILDLLKWVMENYDVGLISNHMPTETEELFKRQIIPELNYKAIVDSCKVGSVKPEAKIYEVARELAGVTAGEILLVDDMRPNITAADRAGWQIQWFDELHPEKSIARVRQALEF